MARNRDRLPDDLKELIALCKEGKLFAVQDWIASGKRYVAPEGNFTNWPLRAAMDVGFHSLVEVLLRAGVDQEEKDAALSDAISAKRLDLAKLLVEFGADLKTLSFDEVLWTRFPLIIRWFIDQGADLETGWPIAEAFKNKQREFLGIYMGLRDKVPSAQKQATMALRLHARDGNLKWVSLLMWAGADPRLPVPNLDHAPEEEDFGTALEEAVTFSRLDVVRKIGIKPPKDNPSALLCECWMCKHPELVEMLLDAGADPNAEVEGGKRNPMGALIQNLEWALDPLFGRVSPEPALKCIALAAKKGGRWRPSVPYEFRTFRRALAETDAYAAVRYLFELVDCGAIEQSVFQELMRTPRMKLILDSPSGSVLQEMLGNAKTHRKQHSQEPHH